MYFMTFKSAISRAEEMVSHVKPFEYRYINSTINRIYNFIQKEKLKNPDMQDPDFYSLLYDYNSRIKTVSFFNEHILNQVTAYNACLYLLKNPKKYEEITEYIEKNKISSDKDFFMHTNSFDENLTNLVLFMRHLYPQVASQIEDSYGPVFDDILNSNKSNKEKHIMAEKLLGHLPALQRKHYLDAFELLADGIPAYMKTYLNYTETNITKDLVESNKALVSLFDDMGYLDDWLALANKQFDDIGLPELKQDKTSLTSGLSEGVQKQLDTVDLLGINIMYTNRALHILEDYSKAMYAISEFNLEPLILNGTESPTLEDEDLKNILLKMELFYYPTEMYYTENENKIEEMNKEKEDAVRVQKFEKAAKIRDEVNKLKEELEEERNKWKNKKTKSIAKLTQEDIAKTIASWTGIPVNKISQDENKKLKNLDKELHKRVVGQNEAVEAVAKAIRRSRVGLKNPNRPIGSFLFLGPTGVGKTELSKALAEGLFGTESAMIRVDMSEFMEPHSVAKLIGAPPGYVGFDDGGQLTEKIRRKPYSVILFDEIEKAHPDVMNMLLQILEDGRLTDSQGRTVNFKNTVIIMTSNIGARLITDKKSLGFIDKAEQDLAKEYEEIKKNVMAELKKELRPEFINRIDDIIVFHKLNDSEINSIIDLLLKNVEERLQEQGLEIKIDKSVKELIAKKGIDKDFGARPLRRAIQNIVEDKLAEEILDGNIKPGLKGKLVSKEDRVELKI